MRQQPRRNSYQSFFGGFPTCFCERGDLQLQTSFATLIDISTIIVFSHIPFTIQHKENNMANRYNQDRNQCYYCGSLWNDGVCVLNYVREWGEAVYCTIKDRKTGEIFEVQYSACPKCKEPIGFDPKLFEIIKKGPLRR
jgi:hypothetical protein